MMVYCRGCGKEIHETAPTCPSCGAPQNLPQSAGNGSRSTVMLVVMTAGWALIFWIGTLFIGGMFAGALNADDPSGAGDGAYSSPGFYGFYPWIYIDPTNAANAWYGIVAREVNTGNANAFRDSIVCGRLIRRAWLTGVAQ